MQIREPYALLYNAPLVVWETDPARVVQDEGVQRFVRAHKSGSFRNHLRSELIHARPFFNAVREKAREETGKIINLDEIYAINAHFTRMVMTHHTTVLPTSFLQHAILKENAMFDSKENDHMRYGGYKRNFSFIISKNRDEQGEYTLVSNYVGIDDEVLKTLKRYGRQQLMEDYVRMFAPMLHDHLHGATPTTFTFSYKGLFDAHGSPAEKEYKGRQGPIKHPLPLREWLRKFEFDSLRLNGYEYWVNRVHDRVNDKLFSPQDTEQMIKNAVSYVEEVGKLKADIEKEEGREKANNIALFMVCNYVCTMQSYLRPGDARFAAVDKAIEALDLPPVRPNLAELAYNVGHFVPNMDADKLFPAIAQIVREGEFDVNEEPLKTLLSVLHHARQIPVDTIETAAQAADVLSMARIQPFEQWPDKQLALYGYFTAHMVLDAAVRDHWTQDGAQGENTSPKSAKFWEDFMLGVRPHPSAGTRILGTLQALKELGIEYGKPIPELTGADAIRYRCLVEQHGFADAVARPEPLVFDGRRKKKENRASDFEILAEYDDVLKGEIAAKRIKRHVVEAAKVDLAEANRYAITATGVQPYAVSGRAAHTRC